jgi:hypothetical protein
VSLQAGLSLIHLAEGKAGSLTLRSLPSTGWFSSGRLFKKIPAGLQILSEAEVDVVDLMEELMLRFLLILGGLCETAVDVVDLMKELMLRFLVILGGLCQAEVDVAYLMEELMLRFLVILGGLCEAEVDVVDVG